MNKGIFLAATFGILAFFSIAFGAYTTFTDLKTTGNMLVGDSITVTNDLTVAGNTSISDVSSSALTLTGIVDVAVTTPTVKGQLVVDSNYDLYISTATNSISDWIKVGTQS